MRPVDRGGAEPTSHLEPQDHDSPSVESEASRSAAGARFAAPLGRICCVQGVRWTPTNREQAPARHVVGGAHTARPGQRPTSQPKVEIHGESDVEIVHRQRLASLMSAVSSAARTFPSCRCGADNIRAVGDGAGERAGDGIAVVGGWCPSQRTAVQVSGQLTRPQLSIAAGDADGIAFAIAGAPVTDRRASDNAARGDRQTHSVRQRLFQFFVRSGGDLADQDEVERFLRCVEAHRLLLPPRLRLAFEMVWFDERAQEYPAIARRLSRREGVTLSTEAVRQRLSRSVRLLERALGSRTWTRRRPVRIVHSLDTARARKGGGRTQTFRPSLR